MVCLFCFAIFLLSSCGGGGGDSETAVNDPGDSNGSQTATGVFKDSTVEGLSYVSGAQSGVTGPDGGFTYEEGEDVTFSIGGVTVGTATGKAVVTPIDLVPGGGSSHTQVQNIVRFLLMLDNDGDPVNGISISTAVRNIAQSWTQVNFGATDLNAALATIISDAASVDGVPHVLPSTITAKSHLEGTFRCVYSGAYKGVYSGGDNGQFGAWISPQNGSVDAFVWNPSTQGPGSIFGSVPISIDADIAFVSGGGFGITFSGQLSSPDHVEGSWSNSFSGLSGTFSGERLGESLTSSIEYRFAGEYQGASFTSADIGYYAINIDISNNVTGAAYSVLTNEEFAITGSVTGNTLAATASDGTAISGTVNNASGSMSGSFSNSGSGISGTYSGRGCKLN